jgi:hypothetical protein
MSNMHSVTSCSGFLTPLDLGWRSLTLIPVLVTAWATLPKTPLPASIVADVRTIEFLQRFPKEILEVRPVDLEELGELCCHFTSRVSKVKFQGGLYALKEPWVSTAFNSQYFLHLYRDAYCSRSLHVWPCCS